MKIIILIITIFLSSNVFAKEAPPEMTKFNVKCPANKLCDEIETEYQRCKPSGMGKDCNAFIDLLKKLSPEYDCQRSFDQNYIVPAVWLCRNRRENDAPFFDAYFHLLPQLNFKKARQYFGSELFRNILDGHYAEEYMEKSLQVEADLMKGK